MGSQETESDAGFLRNGSTRRQSSSISNNATGGYHECPQSNKGNPRGLLDATSNFENNTDIPEVIAST